MKLTTGIRASIFFGSWVVFAIPAAPAEAQQAIITTIAGTGTPGYSGDNDLAITANIKAATGVAVDSAGNLFIADTDNNAVRRVDADTQIITTYAGTPGSGGCSGDNGPAISAQLLCPSGVALDTNGNLFIADYCNNAIRRFDAVTRTITTYAGGGPRHCGSSGDNGPATSARLCGPYGVAVNDVGNLFIADSANNSTRDVTPSATGSSSKPSIATITAAGVATGVSKGSTTIVAVIGSIKASTILSVSTVVLQSITVAPLRRRSM